MNELIKIVAEELRDFLTLNLLEQEDICSEIKIHPKTKKPVFRVLVEAESDMVLSLCMERFQKISVTGYKKDIVDQIQECSRATVYFFEQ